MNEQLATGYMLGRDNNSNNNGFFGGEMAWWIVILLIFGWGNNGNGFGGNRGGGNEMLGYQLGNLATTNDVASGFSTSAIMSKQDELVTGQFGIQNSLCQGFSGVNAAIANLGYQNQQCCCETNRNIDSVRYENAKNTCDIINANNAGVQKIIDLLTQDKIDSLRTELQSAQLQLSQLSQTATLVNTIQPTAKPAYIVSSPYQSIYSPYGFYGNGFCNGLAGSTL